MFWDKNIPSNIPYVLRKLKIGVNVYRYQELYPLSHKYPEGGDDNWLNKIQNDWIVITQDYNFHNRQNELYAIKQHRIGVFYLWGAEARQWDIMRCFAHAYDNIINASISTERPFIYRIIKNGRLNKVAI